MRRQMFNAKIHRAVVTQADLNYEGSLTIDADLMTAAGIIEFEAVHVWNITRGTRLQTYAIRGEPGSGVICVNGAAAHRNRPGDLVIIATFVDLDDAEARTHRPTVIRVDDKNRQIGSEPERPGPLPPLSHPTPLAHA
jgi:aspartate 1-decarboxylase